MMFIKLFAVSILTGACLAIDTVEPTFEETVNAHNKAVVCYWGTWSNYRPDLGKFTPADIDASLCTHLVYSFAGIDPNTFMIKSLDEWMDMESPGLGGIRAATDLKLVNRNLKVTLAIGGWNEGSEKFSAMARTPQNRDSFVFSVIKFLKKHKFDGLDLDWEYPTQRGGSAEDKKNFIYLIQDLRKAFDQYGLILTAAIAASKTTIDAAYDVKAMYQHLDLVHVMCYDYHGNWDRKTGHNAPLKPSPDRTGVGHNNVEATINYLLQLGADPAKTVLGVPFYGRTFSLARPNQNQVSAPALDPPFKGPYTREPGFLGYNEICELLRDEDLGWSVVFSKESQTPYMFKGNEWVSFDDEKSIRVKTDFAFEKNLAGVMVWSIDTDDFSGFCYGPKFLLLRAINNQLYVNVSTDRTASSVDYWIWLYVLIGVAGFVLLCYGIYKMFEKSFSR